MSAAYWANKVKW